MVLLYFTNKLLATRTNWVVFHWPYCRSLMFLWQCIECKRNKNKRKYEGTVLCERRTGSGWCRVLTTTSPGLSRSAMLTSCQCETNTEDSRASVMPCVDLMIKCVKDRSQVRYAALTYEKITEIKLKQSKHTVSSKLCYFSSFISHVSAALDIFVSLTSVRKTRRRLCWFSRAAIVACKVHVYAV